MIRVRGGVEVLLMTTDAVSGRAMKFAAYVAGGAIQRCVCTSECEPSQVVIELRALPRVHCGVALLASRRKTQRSMIGRLGVHVAADMAANAVCRQALKTSHGCVLVARIAFDQRVRA